MNINDLCVCSGYLMCNTKLCYDDVMYKRNDILKLRKKQIIWCKGLK